MVALLSQDVASDFEKHTKIKTIALPKYEKLDIPVSSHADMLLSVIDDHIFFYADYYNENIALFKDIEGYKTVLVKKECKKEYPGDVGLNVLIIGKRIFCNKQSTANEIIEFAENNGYKIINVKQGYSACSALAIDENHAITGDLGMYNALKKENIETLLIDPKEIALSGYNHGFVGGSVGIFNKTAYFFGDFLALKDGKKILDFLNKLNIKTQNLPQNQLFDHGGIKFLK